MTLLPRPVLLLSLLLLTIIFTTTTAFLLPTPSTTCRLPSTRLHLWGGGKKKETPAPPAKAPPAGQKKRATPLNYRGTVVEKEENVIVPATEYFANKKDPIVPILFLGLALVCVCTLFVYICVYMWLGVLNCVLYHPRLSYSPAIKFTLGVPPFSRLSHTHIYYTHIYTHTHSPSLVSSAGGFSVLPLSPRLLRLIRKSPMTNM